MLRSINYWVASRIFFLSCSGKRNRPYSISCAQGSNSPWLCRVLGQGTGRRDSDGTGGARKRRDVEKERRGLEKRVPSWHSPLLRKESPRDVWCFLFPLVLAQGFLSQKRGRSPCGGKDKNLATGSVLCLDGEYSYQPIWCLPESLSIVPSTQTSLSLHQSHHYLQLISLLQEPASLEYLSTFYMLSTQRTK